MPKEVTKGLAYEIYTEEEWLEKCAEDELANLAEQERDAEEARMLEESLEYDAAREREMEGL